MTGVPDPSTPDSSVGSPYRSARAWTAMIAGTATCGAGIAIMLDANLGVSPVDAVFAGTAQTANITVGTALMALSVVFVAVGWLLGARPSVGTAVSFIGIGVAVDVTAWALGAAGVDVTDAGWATRVGVWAAGFAVFAVGVLGLNVSRLGASPYDQLVRGISLRARWSLARARIAVDVAALIAALALGGSIGIGTALVLLGVPIVFALALNRADRWVHPRGPGERSG